MDIKDLVLLRFAYHKDTYPEVLSIEEAAKTIPRLNVDLEAQTWSCIERESYPIGSRRERRFSPECPIGVYDRTNTGHLNQMLKDADKAYHYPTY